MSEGETVQEYAIRRGVHRRTVIDWIKRGLLLARRKGSGKTEKWTIIEDHLVEQLTEANVQIRKARETLERATAENKAIIAATQGIGFALEPLRSQERQNLRTWAYRVAEEIGTDPAKLFAWLERDNETAMEWIETHRPGP